MAVLSDASPNGIIRSRHDSLMLLTNQSACAFKFGLRGGNRTDFTPAPRRIVRNSDVYSASRS